MVERARVRESCVKDTLTFAEKDLANLLRVLQTQLSPLKTESSSTNDLVILITAQCLGHGNEGLGRILMKFFLKSLASGPVKPKLLVLINDGSLLACEN